MLLSTAFRGVLLTGIPGSGKTTLGRLVIAGLRDHGIASAHLEGDALRAILAPNPGRSRKDRVARYTPERTAALYDLLSTIAVRVADLGDFPVLDDVYFSKELRASANQKVEPLFIVHVHCPLEVCKTRRRTFLYGMEDRWPEVVIPGSRLPYDPPCDAHVVIDTSLLQPSAAAHKVLCALLGQSAGNFN